MYNPFCFAYLVTDFSKRTGDYVSLSAVDLKLIALVYQLECELGPEKGRNLRETPIHQPTRLEVCSNCYLEDITVLTLGHGRREVAL